jgi:hypothetical protein
MMAESCCLGEDVVKGIGVEAVILWRWLKGEI